MAVITISRQYGSGGDEIAARICHIMGYRLFDKFLIMKAAAESGLTDKEAVDLSEDNYQLQGFFDRLFNRTRQAAQVWAVASENPSIYQDLPLGEENAIALVRQAILGAFKTGNMVIIGRGGQVVLQDHRDVLHVRIEAPLENRIQFVRKQLVEKSTETLDVIETRRRAQDLIEKRDLASADYLRRFYGVNWEDPLLYHIVINTGRVELELAAQTIAELALHLQPEPA